MSSQIPHNLAPSPVQQNTAAIIGGNLQLIYPRECLKVHKNALFYRLFIFNNYIQSVCVILGLGKIRLLIQHSFTGFLNLVTDSGGSLTDQTDLI